MTQRILPYGWDGTAPARIGGRFAFWARNRLLGCPRHIPRVLQATSGVDPGVKHARLRRMNVTHDREPELPELVSLSVRVTRETADALKAIADREDRSIAAEIRRLIRDRIDADRAAIA